MCRRILGAALRSGRLCPAFPHSAFSLMLSRFRGFGWLCQAVLRSAFCLLLSLVGGFGRFRVALPAPMRIWAGWEHFSGAHGTPVSDPAGLKRVRHGGSKTRVLVARGKVPPQILTDNASPCFSLILASVGSAFCTLPLSPGDASSPLI